MSAPQDSRSGRLNITEQLRLTNAQRDAFDDLDRLFASIINQLADLPPRLRQPIINAAQDLARRQYFVGLWPLQNETFSSNEYFNERKDVVDAYGKALDKIFRQERFNHVVGGVQEERQSGDDAGDDEDGTRGEDFGPGLRGRGAVRRFSGHTCSC